MRQFETTCDNLGQFLFRYKESLVIVGNIFQESSEPDAVLFAACSQDVPVCFVPRESSSVVQCDSEIFFVVIQIYPEMQDICECGDYAIEYLAKFGNIIIIDMKNVLEVELKENFLVMRALVVG